MSFSIYKVDYDIKVKSNLERKKTRDRKKLDTSPLK